jgi:hypothetical protein
MRGKDYSDSTLTLPQRAKFEAGFRRMADDGIIRSREKFAAEGDQIWAFKIHGHRLACFFTTDGRVLITNGYPKKSQSPPKDAIVLAGRIRDAFLYGHTASKEQR